MCDMTSFKEMRDLLFLSRASNFIDDEELLVLYELFETKNPDFPYNYPKFALDDMAESECLADFRFKKTDIPLLAEVLNIPQTIRCDQGTTCDGIEALCMLLRRMSFPCRYGDMIPRFAKPVPVISMITNTVLEYIYDIHGHRITTWNPEILAPDQLEIYAASVSAKGAPLPNCFGFIDGTVRPIARPGENQRVLYNGHKRVHALKFQSVVLPNGLIANMYGPVGKSAALHTIFCNFFLALKRTSFLTQCSNVGGKSSILMISKIKQAFISLSLVSYRGEKT